jgi:hypothetical protein
MDVVLPADSYADNASQIVAFPNPDINLSRNPVILPLQLTASSMNSIARIYSSMTCFSIDCRSVSETSCEEWKVSFCPDPETFLAGVT